MQEKKYRWLHFSDLHLGMNDQTPLWSNLKHHLYDDLPRLFESTGPWDLVIFSGDIVQSGSVEEYVDAKNALIELWAEFAKLDCNPKFFAVPGNHDLARPSRKSMEVMLLRDWHIKPVVRDEFLKDASCAYRSVVNLAFSNFDCWYAGLPQVGIHTLQCEKGLLSGDQAVTVDLEDSRIGIVGLNSTWLQLSGDVRAGDTHIDHCQLSSMLSDAEAWTRSNDFNLLVTHHPVDWMHAHSLDVWKSEIAPPGRFDLHLFGHMHEPFTSSTSQMGATANNVFQSRSLFGLETYSDGTKARLHGYSAGCFQISNTSRSIMIWPRAVEQKKHVGGWKVIPDHDFDLSEANSFTLSLPPKIVPDRSKSVRSAPLAAAHIKKAEPSFAATAEAGEDGLVKRFRHHILPAGAHGAVRKVEQSASIQALESRCFWIVADWGLGSDSFLASVFEAQGVLPPFYRLDLNEVSIGSDVDQEIEVKLGFKIQQLCEELSRLGAIVLLLDDVILADRPLGALPAEVNLESFTEVILDYCPELRIVIRTQSEPTNAKCGCVQIGPLDEADLRTYVFRHPDGGADLSTPDIVRELLLITSGIPESVDVALKQLKVVTLSELVSSYVEGGNAKKVTGSAALQRSVRELAASRDPYFQRTYQLLQALSVFPHGSQFEHVKRFNGADGFYPDNASELVQRGFAIASNLPGLDHQNYAETRKILSVPRLVRDVVRDQMTTDKFNSHNRRASELYFGDNWRQGNTSWPPERKYSSSKCSHHQIANASAILLRLLKIAIQEDRLDDITALVRLSGSYAEALCDGAHYQGAVSFCSTFLHTALGDAYRDEVNVVRFLHARALRMIGGRSKSIEIMEQLDTSKFSKDNRDSFLINLALAYESENDERAIEVAKNILKVSKSESLKIQARCIIIQAEPDSPSRRNKLISLELEARKKNFITAANNIAISLAQESDDDAEIDKYLETVLARSRSKDNVYNETRAVIDMASRHLEVGLRLTDLEHQRLIKAYQYLFIQRIPGLFDKCHKALWRSFSRRNEIDNLFALFRHSSFTWRVRGKQSKEETYIEFLLGMQGAGLRTVPQTRDGGYFKVRAEALGKRPALTAGA